MVRLDLIFLGDSLTAYHDWSSFGSHHNAGIAGDTTDGLLYRLHHTLKKRPKRIIVMIGINDLFQGVPIETIKANYLRLLDGLDKIEEVIVLSLLPVIMEPQTYLINEQVIGLNHFLDHETKRRKIRFIDLYHGFIDEQGGLKQAYTIDGVHLDEQGYAAWERLLHQELDR